MEVQTRAPFDHAAYLIFAALLYESAHYLPARGCSRVRRTLSALAAERSLCYLARAAAAEHHADAVEPPYDLRR